MGGCLRASPGCAQRCGEQGGIESCAGLGAAGVYYPHDADGDVSLSFELHDNVAIFGGFAAVKRPSTSEIGQPTRPCLMATCSATTTLLSCRTTRAARPTPLRSAVTQRAWRRCVSCLGVVMNRTSKIMHGPTAATSVARLIAITRRHVVQATGVDETAVLDGFIVTAVARMTTLEHPMEGRQEAC